MEPTWAPNTTSCNDHPPEKQGPSAGYFEHFNTDYDETAHETNLPYQTEISQQQEEEEQQKFVSYNDNQKLTENQPIDESVYLISETHEESLYLKRQNEWIEKKYPELKAPIDNDKKLIDGLLQTIRGASAEEIEHLNTAYDEMIYRTNLQHQTEISQKQQQFVPYYHNQKLNDNQPVDESVYFFPRNREESLYHKKQKELAEQKWREMQRQEWIRRRDNCLDPSAHQNLVNMQQEDAMNRIFDEKRSTVTVNVKNLCMKRVEMYTRYQTKRPKDNNSEYWNEFVREFFSRYAKKRWCISSYKNANQEVHQGAWKCGLCNNNPGKGFEASYGILANLFKTKYDSGIIEERFSLGIPEGRYSTITGRLTLIYHKVVQETFYKNLYVFRKGKLLVDFSSNLKILSFEFCSQPHTEFIRKSQIPAQINYDGDRYNKSEELVDEEELRDTCRKFVVFARRMKEVTEAPMLNEYGYNNKYVMTLMVTSVLERMKKGTQFSCATGIGPSKNNAFLHDGPSSSSVDAQSSDDGHFPTV